MSFWLATVCHIVVHINTLLQSFDIKDAIQIWTLGGVGWSILVAILKRYRVLGNLSFIARPLFGSHAGTFN